MGYATLELLEELARYQAGKAIREASGRPEVGYEETCQHGKDTPGEWVGTPNFEHDPRYIQIRGADCCILIIPQPSYMDRGKWLAFLEVDLDARVPHGDQGPRLHVDYPDFWPRYYFDLGRAKLECEAWLLERGQIEPRKPPPLPKMEIP